MSDYESDVEPPYGTSSSSDSDTEEEEKCKIPPIPFQDLPLINTEDADVKIVYGESTFAMPRALLNESKFFQLYPEEKVFTLTIPDVSPVEFNAFLHEWLAKETSIPAAKFARCILFLDCPKLESTCLDRLKQDFKLNELILLLPQIPFLEPVVLEGLAKDLDEGILPNLSLALEHKLLAYYAANIRHKQTACDIYQRIRKRGYHLGGAPYDDRLKKLLQEASYLSRHAWKKYTVDHVEQWRPRDVQIGFPVFLWWDATLKDWDIRLVEPPSDSADLKQILDFFQSINNVACGQLEDWILTSKPEKTGENRCWTWFPDKKAPQNIYYSTQKKAWILRKSR